MTRGRAVLVVLVLGVAGFGLSALPWASAPLDTVLTDDSVRISGGGASPAISAASLAVLATGLAVALGGRWVVRLCAAALVVLGGVLGSAAVSFVLDPRPRLLSAAGEASGVREIAGAPTLTPWPYVTALLGVLVVAAAVPVLRVPTTATPGRRFERPAGPAAAGPGAPRADGRVQAMDDWDALGRGEDPTAPERG